MRNKIVEELKKIEKEHLVKILYACESGSRAWGFPSQDSDYDVRFIYIHPTEWYLSIKEERDVIELPINDLLDINGWDLRKALKLFKKSNPPLLEWLQSDIVYSEPFTTAQKIRDLSPLSFSPKSCLYHYLNMAKGNFRDYLQGNEVKIKKYFYVLRPLLACKWMELKQTIPPLNFETLVQSLIPKGELQTQIHYLLDRKKAGEELDTEPRINEIHLFIEQSIQYYEKYTQNVSKVVWNNDDVLDKIFLETLQEVW
ncbi:nucleotidyltransferase domain-containing protein [Chengkuizengella axinellae]|uniref:Nucleotidyltransferase domain-containing protein n=1 Tax=Chengkuizengella axinellae TaxID=3064388 RepID=A0ABT9IY91_9BACL|nr:nucleotidyltransferase domain-containing protein [Chengkuizengella sp. 2205SS18-9]MDP5274112.1 nucleotidyltransferase domain-containing protein [Chengkuizengella sp. 2205SS18-9]